MLLYNIYPNLYFFIIFKDSKYILPDIKNSIKKIVNNLYYFLIYKYKIEKLQKVINFLKKNNLLNFLLIKPANAK